MSLEQVTSEFDKYVIARWAYSIGKSVMDDAAYNVLDYAMRAAYPENEYCKRTWSDDPCPTELLQKYNMTELIQAILLGDKTESIPSLNSEVAVQSALRAIHVPGTLSMKHDGWNVQCNYFRGKLINIKTRGRSQDAVDVSSLTHLVPNSIPVKGKIKIVGELTISKAQFPICKQLFDNVSPRTAVSSVLARPEYYSLLSYNAFDIHGYDMERKEKFNVLNSWGFTTPMWVYVTDYTSLLSSLDYLSKQADAYGQPTDGAVYDGDMRRAIRLLYWEEPVYKSYVTGYTEKYSINRISPSVEIKTVMRKGTRQKQINITNWARIIEYNLQPGAPLAFRIASDATADFDEISTRALHTQWQGKWDEYRALVDENERIQEWKQQQGYYS